MHQIPEPRIRTGDLPCSGKLIITLGDPWVSALPISPRARAYDYPPVTSHFKKGARPLITQVVRAGNANLLGFPAAAGDRLQLLSSAGELNSEITLENPPVAAFILSSARSVIAICDDSSVWVWKNRQKRRIGHLPPAGTAGPFTIVASPDGRRVIRLINAPGDCVLETFVVTQSQFSAGFTRDLRPEMPDAPLRTLKFCPVGEIRLGFDRGSIDLSLVDGNTRVGLIGDAGKRKPAVVELQLNQENPEDGQEVAGIFAGMVDLKFHEPGNLGQVQRIERVRAAYIDSEGNSLVTIEHGWCRRWRQPETQDGRR